MPQPNTSSAAPAFASSSTTTISSDSHMSPKHPRRTCLKKYCGIPLWLLSLLLFIVVIVIVVPVAVMFGKKNNTPQSTVLVPLYVYPSPGAWEPLFKAATNHPTLNFTVVINPASGPGTGPSPDGNYTRDIPRLNALPNVRTVGYVSTSWTNRNLSLALEDVQTYAKWATNASVKDLGMRGIFLDETPAVWTEQGEAYLRDLAEAVRGERERLGGDPLIIHNPGTIPDARFMPSCNLSVVFEGTYSTYQIYGFHKTISAFQSSSKCDREALAAVVHNLPPTLTSQDEAALVRDLRHVAGSMFLTGLATDYYSSFFGELILGLSAERTLEIEGIGFSATVAGTILGFADLTLWCLGG